MSRPSTPNLGPFRSGAFYVVASMLIWAIAFLVLNPLPANAAQPLPHVYNGSITIDGYSVEEFLEQLSPSADVLGKTLDPVQFELSLKLDGRSVTSAINKPVLIDPYSKFEKLWLDAPSSTVDDSVITFHLRLVDTSEYSLTAIEKDYFQHVRWSTFGRGGMRPMNLTFVSSDADADGLFDFEEIILGTFPDRPDTDGDGIKDGEELRPGSDNYITNPLKVDSDGDGLWDQYEIQGAGPKAYRSNPNEPDSDGDGILDSEEVYVGHDGFVTNPSSADTDSDGLLDGAEIWAEVGSKSNPTLADSDGDGIDDAEEVAEADDGYITDPMLPDSDQDGVSDGSEIKGTGPKGYRSNPNERDTDRDGIDDAEEVAVAGDGYITDPSKPDTDSDGINDLDEIRGVGPKGYKSNPTKLDTDGDTITDLEEVTEGQDGFVTDPSNTDTDNDGISDESEIEGKNEFGYRSDPTNIDTDGDGIDDYDEISGKYGFISNPQMTDTDGDGLSDQQEVIEYRTNPTALDTDGDTITDLEEVTEGQDGFVTDPSNTDTDNDGISDESEIEGKNEFGYKSDPTNIDTDGDGIDDYDEISGKYGFISNPQMTDTDGDGLSDQQEVIKFRTNPTALDTDGDGLSDQQEVVEFGTNPNRADSDGDGWGDRTDPLKTFTNIPIYVVVAVLLVTPLGWSFVYGPFSSRKTITDAEVAESEDGVRFQATGLSLSATMSNRGRLSRRDIWDAVGQVTSGEAKRWPRSEKKRLQAEIERYLGPTTESGSQLYIEFVDLFDSHKDAIVAHITALVEDWWGFVPMEVIARQVAPEFIYQGEAWVMHPLAEQLLALTLSGQFPGLRRVPASSEQAAGLEHGYQFPTISSQYSGN